MARVTLAIVLILALLVVAPQPTCGVPTAASASSASSRAPSSARAPTTASRGQRSKHKRPGRNETVVPPPPPPCPAPRQCTLVQQAQFDVLDARVGVLYDRIYSEFSVVQGVITIGDGEDVPDTCQVTVVSDDSTFTTECGRVASPAAPPAYAFVNVNCPSGYRVVSERDCFSTAYDEEGERIGLRTLLKSGSSGSTAYCQVDTQDMLPNTQVYIEQTVRCTDFGDVQA
jgi:hypothetical protein